LTPDTVTVTTVPSGMLLATIATDTGLVVPAGSVTSGVEKRPVGDAGAATPAIELISSVGALLRATVVGCPDDTAAGGTLPKFAPSMLANASMRTRPAPPEPPVSGSKVGAP